jgi:acetylornithine/N-succinyldiaminopimelate aminotransferase
VFPAVMPTYSRFDLAFERGEGTYLFTADGTRYLDFTAGIAVCALGHCHPHLVETLITQGRKLWHTSNLYQVPNQIRLAERLVATSFADTAFFVNSGAEAGELAIKVVRKHHAHAGRPERYRIIGCEGAFHGRTLATLAAAGNEKYLKGFGPPVEGFDHVPFGDLDAMRAAITPETAGIIVEPIQGEGGVRAGSVEYLRGVRQLADEAGLMLIFDEVQCGMGRSGKLWAHQYAGIAPDVMMVAKGIGGGFPLGAVLATEAAAAGMIAGSHGSTYGGNPLATAIGNAVLDVVLAPGFLDQVAARSDQLLSGLQGLVKGHPTILAEARGEGLLLGIRCVVTNTDLVRELNAQKLLTVGAGDNVVRMVPPLNVSAAEVDEALARIDAACRVLEG